MGAQGQRYSIRPENGVVARIHQRNGVRKPISAHPVVLKSRGGSGHNAHLRPQPRKHICGCHTEAAVRVIQQHRFIYAARVVGGQSAHTPIMHHRFPGAAPLGFTGIYCHHIIQDAHGEGRR